MKDTVNGSQIEQVGLHLTARCELLYLTERLLVERDDVEADSKDNDGRTPLSRAAWGGREAVVKLLLERDDVEADSKDEYGWTPLWWAEEKDQDAIVLLLETGRSNRRTG